MITYFLTKFDKYPLIRRKKLYLKPLYKILLKEFNINQFEYWKQSLNNAHLFTKYKNDILKSILNYATIWYGFNFNKILLESLKVFKNEDSKIHGFNDNYFVAGDALADRKNRNCDLAGVPQIRIHDFRHSCASLLINNSANVTVVAKYLRHTKIEEALNTYTHLFSTVLNEVVNVIDNLEW